MELKEALENLPMICEMTSKQIKAVAVMAELGEKVLEIGGKMPKKKGVYDYSRYDAVEGNIGYNEAIDQCTLAGTGLLAEKDKKIVELEEHGRKLFKISVVHKQKIEDLEKQEVSVEEIAKVIQRHYGYDDVEMIEMYRREAKAIHARVYGKGDK